MGQSLFFAEASAREGGGVDLPAEFAVALVFLCVIGRSGRVRLIDRPAGAADCGLCLLDAGVEPRANAGVDRRAQRTGLRDRTDGDRPLQHVAERLHDEGRFLRDPPTATIRSIRIPCSVSPVTIRRWP